MARFILFLISTAVCFASSLAGYSPPKERTAQERALDDMRSSLADLKQKMHSYEVEREIFEEKISNLESTVSSLRLQLKNQLQANEELAKGKFLAFEKRMLSVEKMNDALLSDFKLFKQHANETGTALGLIHNKQNELEQQLSHNVNSIKSALETTLKLSSPQTISEEALGDTSVYLVKSGDSLERIAKAHSTSVELIKKLNKLSSDKIRVGQQIKLPEQ